MCRRLSGRTKLRHNGRNVVVQGAERRGLHSSAWAVNLDTCIMTIEEIRELISLVGETGIGELEVQRGENRVRIRQSFGGESQVLIPSSGASANPAAARGADRAAPPSKPQTPAPEAPDASLIYA